MSHYRFPNPAQSAHLSGRYSAKNNVKPVNFTCVAPQARRVTLMGDFNDWDPAAHPMKRQPDGAWTLQMQISHGPHHYLFCIDGAPALDPRAQGVARNERNEKVSLITVS